MTPEQLKASILQYAIQGKLVEQRLEEGTAEELLSQISSKKEQLIKEKKLKKTKPLEPIIEEELPFDLPQSWKWVKWGDIVNVVSARRVHQSDWQKEGIPFYRAREIAEMSRNNGQVDNELFISEELYNEFSTSGVPKPGDIMVTAVGTLGKTYIVKNGDKFYYKDASVICFENHFGLCSEYLAMMMDTPLMKQQIKSNSDGTTVATLTMVRMNEYLFPLPPLAEQHRIVAKIEELLPFVDRYAASYEKLEQFNAKFPEDMKKSILQYAIQGKLVEQRPEEGTAEELYKAIQEEKQKLIKEGKIKKEKLLAEITENEIPFDIPESWKWVRVNEICSILNGDRGKNYPAKSTLQKEGIPFISALNLDGKTVKKDADLLCLSDEQYNKLGNGKLIQNDIVVCIRGSLGKHGRYPFEKGAIASSLVICRPYSTNDILADYFMMYLDAPLFYSLIKLYDNGTAQPNLAAKSFEQFLLPLPPLKEQKRIIQKVNEMFPYCERLVK